MEKQEFEKLVAEALDELPAEFKKRLDNVAVMVEDLPSWEQVIQLRLPRGSTLFGLYEGIPHTKRAAGYIMVPPDKITIFQRPIEFFYRSPAGVKWKIQNTLLHEIGHHFGLNDNEIYKKIGR